MSCFEWDRLNHFQLGQNGVDYVTMEFKSYGFAVFFPEDQIIDLIVKGRPGKYFEIIVRSLFRGNYTFIQKEKIYKSIIFVNGFSNLSTRAETGHLSYPR